MRNRWHAANGKHKHDTISRSQVEIVWRGLRAASGALSLFLDHSHFQEVCIQHKKGSSVFWCGPRACSQSPPSPFGGSWCFLPLIASLKNSLLLIFFFNLEVCESNLQTWSTSPPSARPIFPSFQNDIKQKEKGEGSWASVQSEVVKGEWGKITADR